MGWVGVGWSPKAVIRGGLGERRTPTYIRESLGGQLAFPVPIGPHWIPLDPIVPVYGEPPLDPIKQALANFEASNLADLGTSDLEKQLAQLQA